MKVQKTIISNNSLIQITRAKSHFEDCYSVTFLTTKFIDLELVVNNSFSSFSIGWIEFLFRLRDWLVGPFKLKTAEDYGLEMPKLKPIKIKKGGMLGFFSVKDVNNEEVLLYTDDSHLSAYFSISLIKNTETMTLSAATTVILNNWFGKVYFFVVKPFHKLIIKSMLHRTANNFIKS